MIDRPLYRITAVTCPSVNPSLVGEVVSYEGIAPDGTVRLDPDFIGEHWYFRPGEIRVTPFGPSPSR